VASRHVPFELTLGAFDGFPNLHRPRVLFYEVRDGASGMARIAAEINTRLAERLGVRAETKPFRAHATVARIKTSIGRPAVDALKAVAPLDGVGQTVTGIDLMESRLGPRGSRYALVKPFALGNGA
jgi:2'-5' RNA ligase